jgi:hypothetical protein
MIKFIKKIILAAKKTARSLKARNSFKFCGTGMNFHFTKKENKRRHRKNSFPRLLLSIPATFMDEWSRIES